MLNAKTTRQPKGSLVSLRAVGHVFVLAIVLLLSACGSDGDEPDIGSGQGTLAVSITGLPAGADADVNVVGSAFNQVLTSTSALLVDVGGYTVNASDVTAQGYTFTADVTPVALSVVEAQARTVEVVYDAVPRVRGGSLPDIEAEEAQRETLNLNPLIDDFENDTLTFTVVGNTNPNVITATMTNGVLAVQPLRDAVSGDATVTTLLTIQITDDTGNAIDTTVEVIATYQGDQGGGGNGGNGDNTPPTVSGDLPDIQVGAGAAPITVDLVGAFTDPDGFNTLTFGSTSTDVTVATATAGDDDLTVTFNNPGTTTIRVTATDDAGAQVSQSFQVAIVGITIPNVTGNVGDDSETIDLDDIFAGLGDNLSYTATSSNTSVVTVAIDDDGILTIDFVGPGTAVVTVTARDPEGNIVSQVSFTVIVAAEGANTGPITRGLPNIIVEENDPARTLNLANFFDDAQDGASGLSYEAVSTNTGVATVGVNGTRLTIAFGVVGDTTINITATDSEGLNVTDALFVNVVSSFNNTAPVATDDTATAIAGISTNINVLANDSDVDSQALTIDSTSQPSAGQVERSQNRLSYTAPGAFTGQVTFTYTIRDTFSATDSATVTVDVVANTGVPVAVDDTATTSQNTATNIGTGVLLANDSDPDAGDTLTVTAVDDTASQGTAVLAGAIVTYTPATDFVGTDTFTYTVSDSASNTATGTVTVTVSEGSGGGGNAPAIGSFTPGTTDATVGTPVTFTYNFANPETGPFTCTFTPGGTGTPGAGLSGTAPNYTVTNCAGQGSVTFTYNNAGDPITVTFTAQNSGGSSNATADLTVTTDGGGGGNTAPTAADDSATTDQDQAVSVDVLANDSDSDGNLVANSVAVTSQPTNGTTNINTTTGAITYTPAAGFTGQDSFTYTVNDDAGATSNAATVTVSVETVAGNETLNLTSDCDTASNVGDTCTVTVSLAGNVAPFGFVGISFDIANPNFQINDAQAAGITAGGTAGLGQNNRTVAIITLAGNLIEPQENGIVARVIFERTQAGASTFTVSGAELGANAADSGASDVVISGTFTLDIP